MPLPVISTLLVGSLGLHLAHHPDVPLPRALAVVERLSLQVQARGTPTVVDDPLWTPCRGESGCADQIKARLKAREVAFISIYEGVQTVRVVARLGEDEHRVQLPLDADAWAPGLSALATALAPELRTSTATVAAWATAAAPEPAVRWTPWVLGAASVAAAGAGIAFGLSAQGTQDDLRAGPLPGMQARDLQSKHSAHAWAANTLVGSAFALAVGAVVTYVMD